jgi:hypothetical protein
MLTSIRAQTREESQHLHRRQQRNKVNYLVRISKQMQHGLDDTIKSWSRFKETDLSYYFSDLLAADNADATATSEMISSIDKDIRQLDNLREALAGQTAMLQSMVSVSFPYFSPLPFPR